jgi:hypothetical protein
MKTGNSFFGKDSSNVLRTTTILWRALGIRFDIFNRTDIDTLVRISEIPEYDFFFHFVMAKTKKNQKCREFSHTAPSVGKFPTQIFFATGTKPYFYGKL